MFSSRSCLISSNTSTFNGIRVDKGQDNIVWTRRSDDDELDVVVVWGNGSSTLRSGSWLPDFTNKGYEAYDKTN